MKLKIHEHTNRSDNFLITSPTYKTMMQSTLPPFIKMMDGFGTHDKKNDVFKLHGGGNVYLRTETDPDSIVGITNIRHIWGDEAGKYRLYFWENIQARADMLGAGIDLTTSPYALNWVFRELIKPHWDGKRPDVEFLSAPSWENPYHSLANPEKREEKRSTMDARRFAMIYGGEFGKMVGLVYDCFDLDANQCEPIKFPTGTKFYAGIDWGYTEPFSMGIRAITPEGNHYKVEEIKKSGLTITDIVRYARQMKQVWDIQCFYCGPDQPGYIEEFNRNGLTAVPADNDIRRGVDIHYELIKTRRFKLFKNKCPHTLEELETYHYPDVTDLGPDESSKEVNPVGQEDHCLDADRYCTMMTYQSQGQKFQAKVADTRQDPRDLDKFFKSLMKKPQEAS